MLKLYDYGKIVVAKRVAPAGAATPPGPDTKRRFVPMSTLPYALRRVHADGREEPVGVYPTFGEGWSAGTRAVTVEDREHAYALYRGGRRVARFGFGRLTVGHSAQSVSALLGPVS